MKLKNILAGISASAMILTAVSPLSVSAYYTCGDISGNEKIDLYDAVEIAEFLVGKRKFTEEEIKIADFNEDGRVNLYDAVKVSEYLLKVMNTFSDSSKPLTSVYCTHLFDHIQNIDDLSNHYDEIMKTAIMRGYPDYNYFEDMLRLICEYKEQDFEEMKDKIDSNYKEDKSLNYEILDMILSSGDLPVIEGKTVGIEYTAYEGKPWTVCEVLVSNVYVTASKYVINKGDMVKIAMPGGYMPVSEYIKFDSDSGLFTNWTEKEINSTAIYEDGSNQKEPKTGDIFTYILNPEDVIPDFPVNDCVTRFSLNDTSQFTRKGDMFICCNSNLKEMYFTSEQISESNFSNIFCDPDSERSIGIKNKSVLMSGKFACYGIYENGRTEFFEFEYPDDGFYPFGSEEDYTVTWTDDGVIINYRVEYGREYFNTVKFSFPK